MNKIEFSDINKFLTSLGLIFIGVALVLPWFINQNASLIILEQEKIEKSSEIAKEIISNQQDYLLFISQHLTSIMISFIGIGIILLIIGILRWKKRQNVIDGIQDEELKYKKQQNISKEEKKEIIENEIDNSVEDKSVVVQKYIDIENLIFLKLSPYYKGNYITSQNIRIGQFNYDVILKSKFIEKRADLILEIKYFNKTLSYRQLLDSTNQFLLAVNHYENTQQRRVFPLILFVLNDNLNLKKITELKDRLRTNTNEIRTNLRIKFFNESEIESIETPKLLADE